MSRAPAALACWFWFPVNTRNAVSLDWVVYKASSDWLNPAVAVLVAAGMAHCHGVAEYQQQQCRLRSPPSQRSHAGLIHSCPKNPGSSSCCVAGCRTHNIVSACFVCVQNLAKDPEARRWYVQAELVHCRTAMVGAAGILIPAVSSNRASGGRGQHLTVDSCSGLEQQQAPSSAVQFLNAAGMATHRCVSACSMLCQFATQRLAVLHQAAETLELPSHPASNCMAAAVAYSSSKQAAGKLQKGL